MAMKSISNKKRPFWKLNRQEQVVGLVLLTGLLVGCWLPERIIIATSDSLKHRVFFKAVVNTNRIEVGDYLLFKLPEAQKASFIHKGLKKDNEILIKRVGCKAGETLRKDGENTFYCDRRMLGKTLEKDSRGNVLPVFTFLGQVPDDAYFMVGSNPRSFDSRYFGFIYADDFIHKAIPLW